MLVREWWILWTCFHFLIFYNTNHPSPPLPHWWSPKVTHCKTNTWPTVYGHRPIFLAQVKIQPTALPVFQPHASLPEEHRFQDSGLGWGRQLMEPNLFLLLLLLAWVLSSLPLAPISAAAVGVNDRSDGWETEPLTTALRQHAARDSSKCFWFFKK